VDTLSDPQLRALLVEDAGRGWRVFVDQYTPMLLALIERAGVRDHDEAMEVYALVCERLVERDCARLRRHDPAKGSLAAWLAVVTRRIVVDWVRARAGRRRLFGAVRRLSPFHQQVFELYFWKERTPAEIAEELGMRTGREVPLMDVLAAIDAIHQVLSDRHRSELLSAAARARSVTSLEAASEAGALDPPDERTDLEAQVQAQQMTAAFESALRELPVEDAAILRLRYVEGLSLRDVQAALHLPQLSEVRIRGVLDRLRERLSAWRGHAAVPVSASGEPR
jgi:DNA-directed RNA polymerase specialized sigma24 family protein